MLEIFPSLPGFLLCALEGYLHGELGSPLSSDKIPQAGTGRGGQGMTSESIPKPRVGAISQMTTAFPHPGTHHPQVPRGLIKARPPYKGQVHAKATIVFPAINMEQSQGAHCRETPCSDNPDHADLLLR